MFQADTCLLDTPHTLLTNKATRHRMPRKRDENEVHSLTNQDGNGRWVLRHGDQSLHLYGVQIYSSGYWHQLLFTYHSLSYREDRAGVGNLTTAYGHGVEIDGTISSRL